MLTGITIPYQNRTPPMFISVGASPLVWIVNTSRRISAFSRAVFLPVVMGFLLKLRSAIFTRQGNRLSFICSRRENAFPRAVIAFLAALASIRLTALNAGFIPAILTSGLVGVFDCEFDAACSAYFDGCKSTLGRLSVWVGHKELYHNMTIHARYADAFHIEPELINGD